MRPYIPNAYRARWSNPDLTARIESDIERHRKGTLVLRVTDATGQPVPDVRVESVQTSSDFHFGANLFMLDGYPTPELNARYEESFLALFNAATVPFYWKGLEPERGKPRYAADSPFVPRRPPPDRVIGFCKHHGLRMHGHTLVWDNPTWSVPDWMPEGDPEKRAALWEARVREVAARYGKHIRRWDVVNEVFETARHGVLPPSSVMPADYVLRAFRWAESAFPPDVRFDLNEATSAWGPWLADYVKLIRQLLDAGARIGGIGLQFHHFTDAGLHAVLAGLMHQPHELLHALDTLAPFGLPLHISEITLTSPGNTSAGQAEQAEVARNLYRLWFSHPSVDGITWWNVPDGGAAAGEDCVASGLLNRDLTPKPAYEALHNLIHREWRTQDIGETDDNGRHQFRGFYGAYRVSLTRNGTTHTREFVAPSGARTREIELSL